MFSLQLCRIADLVSTAWPFAWRDSSTDRIAALLPLHGVHCICHTGIRSV
jgi:hypothetical protein